MAIHTDSTGGTVKYPKEVLMLYEPGVTDSQAFLQWFKTKIAPSREDARIACRNFGIENFSMNIDVDLLVKLLSRKIDLT
jgi:hypothetical protein